MSERRLFFKFLFSSLASAAISSIYSIVDAICVGQYSGSVGSAAISVCMPIWGVVYALGSLFGIGGATLMTVARAKKDEKSANSFFTVSLILATVTALLVGILFWVFRKDILIFFGASNEAVLQTALDYSLYIAMSLPLFVFVNYLMAFVRNDFDPALTAIATIVSGAFNVFGDIFFVFDFGLGMGATGAGLATAIGQTMTVLILCLHFFKKKNQLKITKPNQPIKKSIELIKTGLSAFILDISMGILILLFNVQINNLTNGNATVLGIFGIIGNMMTLVQGFSYAVGQASQPLLSKAYGANQVDTIKKIKKYGLVTATIIGTLFLVFFVACPELLIKAFINTKTNPEAVEIGKNYIRLFFATVPLLSINVFYAYYYQSMKLTAKSFTISFLRGLLLPATFVFILPLINFEMMFIAVALSDLLVFVLNIIFEIAEKKHKENQSTKFAN
jgi:Na+-driven multidrug efflux pump